MIMLAKVFVGLVAVAHLGFLVLEMFLWTTPYALKSFNMTAEYAQSTSVLAANQGLYNGFLAAGLLWSIYLGPDGFAVRMFFLACVVIAGVYGGATVGKKIIFVQAFPAAIAMALSAIARG